MTVCCSVHCFMQCFIRFCHFYFSICKPVCLSFFSLLSVGTAKHKSPLSNRPLLRWFLFVFHKEMLHLRCHWQEIVCSIYSLLVNASKTKQFCSLDLSLAFGRTQLHISVSWCIAFHVTALYLIYTFSSSN